MLNTQEFVYTMDMFRDILHLLVETPDNPFVAPVNIEAIEAFMNRVGYQGIIDKVSAFYTKNLAQPWQTMFKDFMNNVFQKKEAIQYPYFIKLIIPNLMKKFPNIPKRIEEDYHFIKDDIPLVSMYTTGDVRVRGMLISDEFLTEEIYATDDFKEYETVFMNIDVPMNQPQPVVSTQGTHRSTPSAHRIPTLTTSPQRRKRKQSAGESSSPRQLHKITIKRKKPSTTLILPPTEAQENVAKVQEKLGEEEIEKMVEGDEDEESYAIEFADSVLNDDVDDSDEKIEKEKKYNTTKKTDEVAMEKEIVNDVMGSMEIRKEQKQTPISSPTRSPRNVSSYDKTVSEELTVTVSPTPATTSKIREVLEHCNKVVLDVTFAKTKEMITQDMPRLANLVANKDRENTTLILYPTTSSSAARKSSANLQQQLYLSMKSKLQDQAANPEIWEILKAKFEKQ
ncbi:hypothetical protein Tco_0653580 [Tanacetum coccineum]|uniref:SPK domain-containing protein n=1 Tax=Tanacetum coccineum TaxID=301880 RepID=A0ABQ4X0T9_9ASTR